jgi:chaperonin GroES
MRYLIPLGDRVTLRPVAAKEITESGIHLAPQAVEAPAEADVVRVGPDVTRVQVGQRVCYPKYAGSIVTLDDQSVLVMSEREIVGIVGETTPDDVTLEDGSPIPVGAKRLTAQGWEGKGNDGWVAIDDPSYKSLIANAGA